MRTPLTAIRGYLETLLDESVDAEIMRRYLEIARSETLRLGRLVDGMFEVSLLDVDAHHPASPPGSERTRPGDALETALAALAPRIRQREVRIEQSALPRACVAMPFDHLVQMFVNVIANALDHGREEGRIAITGAKGARIVEIRFDDDGPGVPVEEREAIFTFRYRARSAGAGLGARSRAPSDRTRRRERRRDRLAARRFSNCDRDATSREDVRRGESARVAEVPYPDAEQYASVSRRSCVSRRYLLLRLPSARSNSTRSLEQRQTIATLRIRSSRRCIERRCSTRRTDHDGTGRHRLRQDRRHSGRMAARRKRRRRVPICSSPRTIRRSQQLLRGDHRADGQVPADRSLRERLHARLPRVGTEVRARLARLSDHAGVDVLEDRPATRRSSPTTSRKALDSGARDDAARTRSSAQLDATRIRSSPTTARATPSATPA